MFLELINYFSKYNVISRNKEQSQKKTQVVMNGNFPLKGYQSNLFGYTHTLILCTTNFSRWRALIQSHQRGSTIENNSDRMYVKYIWQSANILSGQIKTGREGWDIFSQLFVKAGKSLQRIPSGYSCVQLLFPHTHTDTHTHTHPETNVLTDRET